MTDPNNEWWSAERKVVIRGCLPFIKFWLGIFVRVVYHLPKISGLSRFVRLDSSYNMKLGKLVRNLKKLVNDKRISLRSKRFLARFI